MNDISPPGNLSSPLRLSFERLLRSLLDYPNRCVAGGPRRGTWAGEGGRGGAGWAAGGRTPARPLDGACVTAGQRLRPSPRSVCSPAVVLLHHYAWPAYQGNFLHASSAENDFNVRLCRRGREQGRDARAAPPAAVSSPLRENHLWQPQLATTSICRRTLNTTAFPPCPSAPPPTMPCAATRPASRVSDQASHLAGTCLARWVHHAWRHGAHAGPARPPALLYCSAHDEARQRGHH